MAARPAASVLALVATLALAGCTAGTATPTGNAGQTSAPPAPIPTVTTVPGGPTLQVSVATFAPETDPRNPPREKAVDAKYHNSRSLCDAVLTRPVAGFTPTHLEMVGNPGEANLTCRVTDDHKRHVTVVLVTSGPRSALTFDRMTHGGEAVSGIGDRAILIRDSGVQLGVLKGDTFYIVVANLGGDEPGTTSPPDDRLIAVEKDLALAVV